MAVGSGGGNVGGDGSGEDRGRQLLLNGIELDRHGRTEEAERLFREAAEEYGDFNGMYNLALLAERTGRIHMARLWYTEAFRHGHPEAANNLGVLLHNQEDPDAVQWFRIAAATGHPHAAANLQRLRAARAGPSVDPETAPVVKYLKAEAAFKRFEETGDDAALVAAVNITRDGVRLAPEGHPARATLLGALRGVLRHRYDLRGHTADLREAVTVVQEELSARPPDDPGRTDAARAAVALLRDLSQVLGDVGPVRQAVDIGRQALTRPGGDEGSRAHLEASLCGALTSLAVQNPDTGAGPTAGTGGTDAEAVVDGYLDEAVALGRAAVGRLPADDAVSRTNLGAALHLRGSRRSSPDDLDEAVALLRAAARSADNPRHGADAATNLASALRSRASLTRRSQDRREAEEVAEEARTVLREAPADHPRTLMHSLFAAGRSASSDEARRALAAVPRSHALRPKLLLLLATALEEEGDRDAAVVAAREAAATAVSRESTVEAQRLLGSLLLRPRDGTGPGRAEVEEAVNAFTAAVAACETTDVDRAEVLIGLSVALVNRFLHAPDGPDRDAALTVLREAAHAVGSSPQDRLSATRMWAGLAHEAGDTADALVGARVAVSLLRDVGWTGLERADQEQGLRGGAAMPREAAALAIIEGRPELAVELLEQGRSVLWRSTLHLRDDLASLAAREPSLAAEFEEIRSALDGAGRVDPETRMRLARRWTRLRDRVRSLPGFERFLAPPAFGELAPAAAEGPVVIVNISAVRCDALLVLPGGQVDVVPLPDVDFRAMDRVCNTYLEHLGDALAPGATGRVRQRARHTVHDTLEWLWERIARPVLDRLELPYRSEAPPRIWWCPTASLVSLPLHAAGRYPRTGADRTEPVGLPFAVVSSYTSTLAALVDARRRPAAGDPRLLAVALSDTKRGHAPLPGVPEELRGLREVFGLGRLSTLADGAATVAAVREQLPGHPWAHFACHGRLDMNAPATSGLCLRDGDMNVLDFAELRLNGADLAFLSACHTRLGGGQPDEAIHTAAALRMAGFRHVVSTMWSVQDRVAPAVAAAFYRNLGASGGLCSAGAAVALHRAVAELRDADLTNPMLWAPFTHDGP
ncbi:CHAT domain-containing protein [Streptomyces sp. Tu 2975]|uniref:CHAT domain-containing protein n=1 Tax=Streptomyces sp. Tu 2975 TaxID=2676871 RepID=UPI001358811E|nr:CHAT domain-containing protein [Streptomyces sp. Tu 2975]QIP86805.1 CHAT domain-containing protein [Streptomyces sp. Tu 2975]